jgi:RNA polymerase sigma-70 factor (ECF subfamily)
MRIDDPAPPPPPAADETASLVEAARAGDREAFARLVESHQRGVTRLAYRLLGDADEADGAAQNTFIKAWGSLGEFRAECPFGAWLARIVVNQCRDRLKARGRRLVLVEARLRTTDGGSPLDTAVDPTPDPETRLASRELGRKIAELSRALPDMQRDVFALRYYDNRSLAEIAAVFRVEIGTVKTHLFRATRRMRTSLEALYGKRLPF